VSALSKTVTEPIGTILERRWLVWYLIQRQLSQSYQGSFLGVFWIFLGPLLMIILYTLVFSEIVGLRFRQTDSVANFGLYLYCGLIPFQSYSDTINKAVSSIRQNSTLVRRVVFPLEVLPLSRAAASVINQLFGFAALLLLVLLLEHELQWTTLLVPLIMVPQLLFNLGLGYLGAVAGTYLPDIEETLRAVVRATFFVTPIIWPPELAEGSGFEFIVDYNPVAFLVEAYRNLLLDGRLPEGGALLLFTGFSAALAVAGLAVFAKAKKGFADLL